MHYVKRNYCNRRQDFIKAVFMFQQKTGRATSWEKVQERLGVKLGVNAENKSLAVFKKYALAQAGARVEISSTEEKILHDSKYGKKQ